MNEMKRVLEIELGLNRKYLLYKTGDTKKIKRIPSENIGLQYFGLAISNRTTTTDNAANDQVYLKAANLQKLLKNLKDQNFQENKLKITNS